MRFDSSYLIITSKTISITELISPCLYKKFHTDNCAPLTGHASQCEIFSHFSHNLHELNKPLIIEKININALK